MKCPTKFNTQKAAVKHLEELGWQYHGRNLGDKEFRRAGACFRNLVVQLRTGQWKIHAYG
jgi:hypothetical protein